MSVLKCLKIQTAFYFATWFILMTYAAESEKFVLIIPAIVPFVLSLMGFKAIKGARR